MGLPQAALVRRVLRCVVCGAPASFGAAQSAVQSIGNKVVNEVAEILVVPLAAGSWQIVGGCDVLATFHAELQGVPAANGRDGISQLIDVLHISLRSQAERTDIAAKFIDFDVRKIRKLAGHHIVWPA